MMMTFTALEALARGKQLELSRGAVAVRPIQPNKGMLPGKQQAAETRPGPAKSQPR